MANTNVGDNWWVDIRRSALIRMLKDEERADGAALRLWRVGFEYWKKDRALIPKHCFDLLPCASELLACALVELKGASIYVKGASEYFDWVFKKREAGRKGGVKSVENRRKTNGTAQPISKQTRSTPEADSKHTSNQDRSNLKHAEPSSSISISISNKKNTYGPSNEDPATEALYKLYPRRLGNQRKKPGIATLTKILKYTPLEEIEKAIKNYADHCRACDIIGTKEVMQFATFMNVAWEEWVIPPNGELALTHEQKVERNYIFQEEK